MSASAPEPLDKQSPETLPDDAGTMTRMRRWLIGRPRDLNDRSIFHHLSLIPFLAWVGLGADGLSSSCYGPEEAFKTLGQHTYLALALAVVMAATVCIISIAYSRVIEHFPHGGGGYVVATKLLGRRAGLVSGSALLVDYVLTITISIAAAGDALFSFMPLDWHGWKLPAEFVLIVGMMILNFRGVRESVIVLTPIFLLFVATHFILIAGGLVVHAPELPGTLVAARRSFGDGITTLGLGGMLLVFIHAYSLGGGTYTGIEAVSNGLAIMREPRVRTGKRTMLYMAASLAFTASGLLLCYLLWDVAAAPGKTMNAVLAEKFITVVPLGSAFVVLTLFCEGALLVVAAQAGFVDGPRVLGNMALDGWVPRRFAALSDRLTTQNGILLMGFAALAALIYTGGDVRQIVVMYSINVFITFSMTESAMCWMYFSGRRGNNDWKKKISIHIVGLTMCLTILVVTIFEKFLEGGWVTLIVTGAFIAICALIRLHYDKLTRGFLKLNKDLEAIERIAPVPLVTPSTIDPAKPTGVVLVTSYSGLGIHTILHIQRAFSGYFKNLVFVSVGVIDSGGFKGDDAIDALRTTVQVMLDKYVTLARRLGFAATSKMSIGTEVVSEAEALCLEISREYSKCVFFTGQVIFARERWYQRLLHNQTAFAIQKRLQWDGMTMMILP
ncbi:MAG TPA: APC family permease, partial [Phycisphaerae bacterium]|nr:APC family permease [Phycisphaerae bacterium]